MISYILCYSFWIFFKSKATQNACSRWTSQAREAERLRFLPIHNYQCFLARVSREMGLCYNLRTLKIKIWVGSQFYLPWSDLCWTAAGFLLCLLFSWLWLCVLWVHLSNPALQARVLNICLTFLGGRKVLTPLGWGLRDRISLFGA